MLLSSLTHDSSVHRARCKHSCIMMGMGDELESHIKLFLSPWPQAKSAPRKSLSKRGLGLSGCSRLASIVSEWTAACTIVRTLCFSFVQQIVFTYDGWENPQMPPH
eukprot:4309551-Amphidinium_carterae.2